MIARPRVVVVHGLGGSPRSVAPLVDAVTRAGFDTVAPTLPGHGTVPGDLVGVRLQAWLDAVDAAAGTEGVVIVGQSLGGSLAVLLAAERPNARGIATINALVRAPDPDAVEHLEYLIERGRTMQPAGPPDLRDPSTRDDAYEELALSALLELGATAAAAGEAMRRVTVPALVVSGDLDSVVDPGQSDDLAAALAGPVERLRLPNSGHVAALDFDRVLLCAELLTWLSNLTDPSASAG